MIIEVLSPSTEAFDLGEKFTYYRSIPSLGEYLLIATSRPLATQFIKKDEKEWIEKEAAELNGKLHQAVSNAEILLSEIYIDVVFPKLETTYYYSTDRDVKSPACSPLHAGLSGMAADNLANDQTFKICS